MPPVDRDRSRVDDMALDPVGEQQAMNPKPVQSRFLNDDRFDLHAVALLGLRPRPRKKVEQASAVSTLDPMLGKLVAARTVDRHNPFRFAQFERGEQRDIIRAGGGRDSGRGGDRLHRLPPCWCGSSAYQVRPPSTRIRSFSALLMLWLSRWRRSGSPRERRPRDTARRAHRGCDRACRPSSTDRNNRRPSIAAASPWGKSLGIARHWQPVLKTYIRPLTTSPTSTVRLLPPRLAGGMCGPISAHSSSLRSLG